MNPTRSIPAATHQEVARRLFEECWSKGDIGQLPELFAPRVALLGEHMHMEGQSPYGPDTAREEIEPYRKAFPDLALPVVSCVAQGEWVMSAWEGGGTHQGELMGLAPTGRRLWMAGIYLARVVDGRITAARQTVDTLAYHRTLGALPEEEPGDGTHAYAFVTGGDRLDMSPGHGGDAAAEQGAGLVRRLVEEVWSGGACHLLPGFLHPARRVEENLSLPAPGGAEAAAARHATLLTAAPDLGVRLDHLVADGDLVGYGWTASGTQTGPLGSLAPTGRRFTFMGTSISRITDGRIGDTIHRYDTMALLEQIGRLPPARGTLEIFG
ncbi:ester cyclase family protein [Streptomyces sp. NPDC040750]|uniref:ester cyclase n=1 Tax=Streptomyces sp. NPDC040750 TaxID=3154491 RepID=UPI0033F5F7F8